MRRLLISSTWLALALAALGCAVNPVPTPASGGGGSANVGGGGAAAADGMDNQAADAGVTAGGGMDQLAAGPDAAASPETAVGTDATVADTGPAPDGTDATAVPDTAAPQDAQADLAAAQEVDAAVAPDAAPDTGPAPDTAANESLPPTEQKALAAWLSAGSYKTWKAESKIHNSTGPHFGGVKTFVSAKLFDSLTQGAATHPVDSATVKELYGSGSTVLGWSVMRKTQAGVGGNTWWWYEDYGGKVYAAGQGVGLCTGCHSPGKDYFLTPFPLQ